MSPKVKVGGEEVDGEHLEFEVRKDQWQEISLPDGTILKIKLVVTDVLKTTKKNDAGEPVYLVRSVPVLSSGPKGDK